MTSIGAPGAGAPASRPRQPPPPAAAVEHCHGAAPVPV